MKKWFRKFIKILKKPEMRILPSNLAFFLLLSIFPIITLTFFIASFFNISIDTIINIMNEVLPNEVSNILISITSGGGINTNLIIFMITGFIIASNGAHSLIIASNLLYKFENSTFLKRRIKAFILTIILVSLVIFSILVLGFGNSILRFILSFKIFKNTANTIYSIFILFKWPVAFLGTYIMIKLLFTSAPDERIKSNTTSKGALFTTLGWMLITAFYSYYVNNFTNYNLFYGSLSNIMVLLMWLYILSYIIVIGIAINANQYHILEKSNNDNEK